MKVVQNLYSEKYKTLLKEIKDIHKWKDTAYSWTARLNTVKRQPSPNRSSDSTSFYGNSSCLPYRNGKAGTRIHIRL